MISYSDIRSLSRKGNVIPVYKRIPADLDTPVSAFVKLAGRKRYSFLLESVEGGEKLARYSFLGCDPFLTVEGSKERVVVRQGGTKREFHARPDDFLKELFKCYRPVKIEGLPRFTGGAVGYFSYDSIRWFEDIPDTHADRLGMPEMWFGLYATVVAFDHIRQEIVVIANILHEPGDSGLRRKYDHAVSRVEKTISRLTGSSRRLRKETSNHPRVKGLMTQAEFVSMVRKAKRYIREGDIFQVVLSQRWKITADKSSLGVYRKLRRMNPSPYMFLLNLGKHSVIGASPEMLVRVEGRRIETRPIAGTRPRGRSGVEDDRLAAELLADEKELAEHTMLLDLGRNDIGRVSEPGSVRVEDRMIVEKYSHVMHICSSVVGGLQRGVSSLEGLFACFPAGTVSGAPKIRAMEIIDELEKERRSVYAGAIAYIDFWGNLDSCIAIRTVVRSGDTYYVQAGAGIVADSGPVREFKETEAKAKALIEAITEE